MIRVERTSADRVTAIVARSDTLDQVVVLGYVERMGRMYYPLSVAHVYGRATRSHNRAARRVIEGCMKAGGLPVTGE